MSSLPYTEIKAESDASFVTKGVELLTTAIQDSITARGRCLLGLSGGSTPGDIYTELGKNKSIPWSKVTVFLVDDRYIAPESADSNQQLLRKTLFRGGAVESAKLVFPDPTLPTLDCVRDYDERLSRELAGGQADVLTLGMGDDGHIASLFPPLETAWLGGAGAKVIHSTTEQFAVRERLSLTLDVIQAARYKLFLLKANKMSVWEEMLASTEDVRRWPAKGVLQSGNSVLLRT